MSPLPQEQLEARKDTDSSNSVIAKRPDTDQPDAEKENSDGKNAQTQVEKEKPEKDPESKGQVRCHIYVCFHRAQPDKGQSIQIHCNLCTCSCDYCRVYHYIGHRVDAIR